MMSGKLHRVTVTEADRDYVGSITIDADLLQAVGILPLEEVEVVNLGNGNRWSTYILPGVPGSGMVCSNGGGALLCQPGDLLIVWSNALVERETVLRKGHTARVAVVDERNRIKDLYVQTVARLGNEVTFTSVVDPFPGIRQRVPARRAAESGEPGT